MRKRKASRLQHLQHLVVVVPGIGGSVLHKPDGRTWELAAAPLAATVVRPSTLSLDRFPEMRPTGLVTTFTALGSMLTIPGYEGVSTRLLDSFQDVVVHVHQTGRPIPSNVDVLLFPYDFRRSVTDAAERLGAAVHEALGPDAPARRVVVLAHSMGGLVARYWLGPLGGWPVCSALMTLGTPHRGAPKALQWLVRGPGMGPLRHVGVREVLRGWPSMYELLPQYPAVWDAVAGREVELTTLPRSSYADRFARMAAAGRQVHEDIAAAWAAIPPERVPDVLPFFGRGHATPNLVTLAANGRLVITKEDPPWRGNVGWAGDSTVPMLSAIPRELSGNRAVWRGTVERHGPLANTLSFLDPLRSYSGEPLPTRGTEAPTTPWLGLDVEDVVPADTEVPVGMRVHPEGVEAERVRLTVTPVPGVSPVFTVPMNGTGRTWQTALPALAPGRYRLDFEARLATTTDSVFADADVVVLDAIEEAAAAE
ncbi:lipase/acyltransferase domain-containing protein [Actinophytocola sp.]|uniref:lipase/acyltransferase domain-containing protein n=1 Tax=Actinophytocola sp. TaxID=1872138 RepID=UPI00389B19C5